MKQKQIAVRLSGTYRERRIFDDSFYLTAYVDLAHVLAKRGGILFLTKDDRFYEGGNTFSRGWKFDVERSEFCDWKEPFTADLIFNKDGAFNPGPGAHTLNRKEFDTFCNNKQEVSERFPRFSPVTCVIN